MTENTPDLLRRAANRLREVVSAAAPGPWSTYDEGQGVRDVNEEYVSESFEQDNATYIALMHPPVALTMAKLLDTVARDCGMATTQFRDAATAARAVLREDS